MPTTLMSAVHGLGARIKTSLPCSKPLILLMPGEVLIGTLRLPADERAMQVHGLNHARLAQVLHRVQNCRRCLAAPAPIMPQRRRLRQPARYCPQNKMQARWWTCLPLRRLPQSLRFLPHRRHHRCLQTFKPPRRRHRYVSQNAFTIELTQRQTTPHFRRLCDLQETRSRDQRQGRHRQIYLGAPMLIGCDESTTPHSSRTLMGPSASDTVAWKQQRLMLAGWCS